MIGLSTLRSLYISTLFDLHSNFHDLPVRSVLKCLCTVLGDVSIGSLRLKLDFSAQMSSKRMVRHTEVCIRDYASVVQ